MITVTSTYNTPASLIELLQQDYPLVVSDLELLIASSNVFFVPGPFDLNTGTRSTVGRYTSEEARTAFIDSVNNLFVSKYSITYEEALTAMGVTEVNVTA